MSRSNLLLRQVQSPYRRAHTCSTLFKWGRGKECWIFQWRPQVAFTRAWWIHRHWHILLIPKANGCNCSYWYQISEFILVEKIIDTPFRRYRFWEKDVVGFYIELIRLMICNGELTHRQRWAARLFRWVKSLLLRSHVQMLLYPYNQTYRQTFQTKPLVSDILVLEFILNPDSCYMKCISLGR